MSLCSVEAIAWQLVVESVAAALLAHGFWLYHLCVCVSEKEKEKEKREEAAIHAAYYHECSSLPVILYSFYVHMS